jgi:hypothetical protein
MALVSLASLSAAQKPSKSVLNGVWHQAEGRVENPASSVNRAVSQGMTIIFDGHFTQVYVGPPARGVQQAARVSTAEEKAARYDDLTANGGTFDMTDTTFVLHYQVSKNPAQMASQPSIRYRLRGDSLWQTTVTRWTKDTTKTVRTTYKWVRERP